MYWVFGTTATSCNLPRTAPVAVNFRLLAPLYVVAVSTLVPVVTPTAVAQDAVPLSKSGSAVRLTGFGVTTVEGAGAGAAAFGLL